MRTSVAEGFLRVLTCGCTACILRAMELRVKCAMGSELREIREGRHLTQAEAAEQVGVSTRVWQLWESSDPPTPRAKHRRALVAWLEPDEVAA